MGKENKKFKIVPEGKFNFLSVGWWILHIILILLVFFVLTKLI